MGEPSAKGARDDANARLEDTGGRDCAKAMSIGRIPPGLRSIVLPVYLPTLIFSIGEGGIIPIIPASAVRLGASLATSGLVAGAIMFGQLFGDVPSGWIVSRVGERRAMTGAAVLSAVAATCCTLATSYLLLALGIFLVGVSSAVFALARHAFLATSIPLAYRARALSTLGGVFRAGYFVGPPVSVGAIALLGLRGVYLVHLLCCVAAVVVLFVLRDVQTDAPAVAGSGGVAGGGRRTGMAGAIRQHGGVLARLGGATLLMGTVRSARTILLPLYAEHLGIRPSDTALIVGLAAACEIGLFYTSGQIMDRFGRMWSALPCLVGLALGHAWLVFVHGVRGLVLAAVILGVSNGVGSGIQMTVGADIAPRDNPAALLGVWRLLGDSGSAAAPLIISGIVSAASLSWAGGAICLVGLASAQLMARYLPRYCPAPAPRARPLAPAGAERPGLRTPR